MKKFYLGALGCLLTMGVSAQTFESIGTISAPESDWDAGFLSIPGLFAVNGVSTPFTFNETEGGDIEFNVYNKSFAVERTIKYDVPTSYRRVEVEARKAVVSSTEETADCGYIEGYSWEIQSYRDYYAKYCCEDTAYTDEYVYEWLEYMKEERGWFEGFKTEMEMDRLTIKAFTTEIRQLAIR